jgi:DNA-directed RNA polymerase subunit RPC12/RpoP
MFIFGMGAAMSQHRRPAFERMEATLLACPRCNRAVKVRKRLLLVLPEGDKYEYVCPDCGSTCGSTVEQDPQMRRLT